jgi:hypothetical protein
MSDTNSTANPKPNVQIADLGERVRVNQKKLASELKPHYDFIVLKRRIRTLDFHQKAAGLQHQSSHKTSCNRILESFLFVE